MLESRFAGVHRAARARGRARAGHRRLPRRIGRRRAAEAEGMVHRGVELRYARQRSRTGRAEAKLTGGRGHHASTGSRRSSRISLAAAPRRGRSAALRGVRRGGGGGFDGDSAGRALSSTPTAPSSRSCGDVIEAGCDGFHGVPAKRWRCFCGLVSLRIACS